MSVELIGIHKSFGEVRANAGIDLEIGDGELLGVLGENGAGKSTLMKILSGFQPADSGTVLVDGEPIALGSPVDAIAHGIGMLHQDPLVFLPMSVLENFVLGAPRGTDFRAARAALLSLCEQFGFALAPDAAVRRLSVGERQQLEIVRLLWRGARVLIFDEPTTAISATQRDRLFGTLRTLTSEGMSVIFVSHKLEEALELCTRIVVMRRGEVVAERPVPTPVPEIVELMFGSMIAPENRPDRVAGSPLASLEDVAVADRLVSVRGVELEIASGEVVGLAGLEGSGQLQLLRACAGLLPFTSGRFTVGGEEMTRAPYRERLASGIQLLTAGRLEEGLVDGLTITEHLALVDRDGGFLVDWEANRSVAADEIARFSIRGTPESMVESLSGGNQQRLLLALLRKRLRILLMEHPTRGLDVESARWVWSALLARRSDGTAIVFSSADLDELVLYSDRIAVFFAGEVIDVVDARAADVEQLGRLIGGSRR